MLLDKQKETIRDLLLLSTNEMSRDNPLFHDMQRSGW